MREHKVVETKNDAWKSREKGHLNETWKACVALQV